MVDIHNVIGKIPFKPKKGFVLPKYRFTGRYNPLHLQLDPQDNPLPGDEPYNAVDAISMRHDICYPDGKEPFRKVKWGIKCFGEVFRKVKWGINCFGEVFRKVKWGI